MELDRLRGLAERGDVQAAWARAHYLLDLFDDARFRRDATSRAMLATTLKMAPARGSAATTEAIDGLLVEVDRVLAIDRLHAGAQQARTLLELDRERPRDRAAVLQKMIELKTVARGGGEMAPGAVLRLTTYCTTAAEDSLRAKVGDRARIIAHCLYPLWDSDPEPYFAESSRIRPPPPDPVAIGARVDDLLGRAAWGRLALAGAEVRERSQRWFAQHAASLLPLLPDPERAGLPAVDAAPPYDWTPLLDLGDGRGLSAAATYAKGIGASVLTDGRGTVAVALQAHAPASALLRAAEAAVASRAHTLELLVSTEQRLSVPAGDYWSGRLEGDRVRRHAVLRLFLAAMPGAEAIETGSTRPVQWDPAHAALELSLEITPDRWKLAGAGGELAAIEVADPKVAPTEQLRRELERIRRAFPDEDGLLIVPGAKASYGSLATAIAALGSGGGALFSRLALAPARPAITSTKLAQRITRRAPATIDIRPQELSLRAAIARRCYQDLLESAPTAAGEIRLELAAGKITVTGGAGNKKLRACAQTAVGPAMAEQAIPTALVTFSLAP